MTSVTTAISLATLEKITHYLTEDYMETLKNPKEKIHGKKTYGEVTKKNKVTQKQYQIEPTKPQKTIKQNTKTILTSNTLHLVLLELSSWSKSKGYKNLE